MNKVSILMTKIDNVDAPQTSVPAGQADAETLKKIAALRAQVRESFGKIVMAMDPLIRDRVAIAHPSDQKQGPLTDISGLAIWASVSEEVDAKLREQIKAGTWPVRLQAEDWASGDINWLIDVIAADQKTTVSVLSNFKQVVKEGDLRLHPLIGRLVDKDTLAKMTVAKQADE